MNRRGFTALEMLASIAVAAVVLVILASATRSQGRSAVFQMGSADVQQNVRGALDLFTRELRMAGYGMAAVLPEDLAPIEVVASADPYSVVLRGNFANVHSNGSALDSTVTLDPTAAPFPTFTAGKQLAVMSEILGVAEVRTIASYNAATGVISLNADLDQVYEAGSPVNQLDAVTYRLDAAGVLWRDGDPMADQLNLLQLSYVLADGAIVADPAGGLATLRGAAVRMGAQKPEHDGLLPRAEFATQVRIRNLGIAGEPEV